MCDSEETKFVRCFQAAVYIIIVLCISTATYYSIRSIQYTKQLQTGADPMHINCFYSELFSDDCALISVVKTMKGE